MVHATVLCTSILAGLDVNHVVPGALVCDPSHAGRHGPDKFSIPKSDFLHAGILVVNPCDIIVFSTGLHLGQEVLASR